MISKLKTTAQPLLPYSRILSFSSTNRPPSFYQRIDPYLRLARVEKQIGTQLLLLPCYWGLALASPTGIPSLLNLALFTVGAVSCRSAGCVINDLADRDIDKSVERTKARPLTSGELTPLKASLFLSSLMALNFSILFQLPWEAVKYGLMVTPLVFVYPTTKRYFKLPQLVLGATFNSGVFIGYAAQSLAAVDISVCLPFYLGGILWTLVYDTIYAFQDREFDKKLQLQSAAIAFEDHPKAILSCISAASIGCFLVGGLNAGLAGPYYFGLVAASAHYAWQIWSLEIGNAAKCGALFRSNVYLGLYVGAGIVMGKAMS